MASTTPLEQRERNEAILAVVKAVIQHRHNVAGKDRIEVRKVNSVFLKIRLSLPLVPFESHAGSVATLCRYVNSEVFAVASELERLSKLLKGINTLPYFVNSDRPAPATNLSIPFGEKRED